MEKEKVMVTIEFEGGAYFVVDFKNMHLRDFDKTGNIIELKDMRDTGDGYEFFYDPIKMNIAEVPEGFVQQDTGPYVVKFEYLTTLHPQAMATAHGIPVEMLANKTDRDFLDAISKEQKQETSKKSVGAIKPSVKERRRQKKL